MDQAISKQGAKPMKRIAVRSMLRLVKDKRGSELVEFALAAVVLLTAILGIMDCCRALYAYHFVSWAAQQGTRYAAVRGAEWGSTSCATATAFSCNATSADVVNYVQSLVNPGISASALTVQPDWPGATVNGPNSACATTHSQGCMVKVQVSYAFSFILPFMPKSAMTFNATSERPIQQ
jgi:Flp pilus assembly protein TadG